MWKPQVPPTLFWPYDGPVEYAADGKRVTVAGWNYQCPQCKHQGALLDASGRCLLREMLWQLYVHTHLTCI